MGDDELVGTLGDEDVAGLDGQSVRVHGGGVRSGNEDELEGMAQIRRHQVDDQGDDRDACRDQQGVATQFRRVDPTAVVDGVTGGERLLEESAFQRRGISACSAVVELCGTRQRHAQRRLVLFDVKRQPPIADPLQQRNTDEAEQCNRHDEIARDARAADHFRCESPRIHDACRDQADDDACTQEPDRAEQRASQPPAAANADEDGGELGFECSGRRHGAHDTCIERDSRFEISVSRPSNRAQATSRNHQTCL